MKYLVIFLSLFLMSCVSDTPLSHQNDDDCNYKPVYNKDYLIRQAKFDTNIYYEDVVRYIYKRDCITNITNYEEKAECEDKYRDLLLILSTLQSDFSINTWCLFNEEVKKFNMKILEYGLCPPKNECKIGKNLNGK